jgi:hypothetical protein
LSIILDSCLRAASNRSGYVWIIDTRV